MRRTSISLAIVALLLCGKTVGQVMTPQGEPVAPGIAAPATQSPIYPATASPGQEPDAQMSPEQQALEPQPEMNDFVSGAMANNWNQPPVIEDDPNGIGPCCALCGNGKCCPKNWYVDQRIRIMTHPRPRDIVFSNWHTRESIGFNSSGQEIIDDVYTPATSTRTTPFNLSASYEITVGKYLGLDTDKRNHFLEFTFYGTNEWSSGNGVISSQNDNQTFNEVSQIEFDYGEFGNITSGGRKNVAGFNRADRQWAEYSSSLNNFEVNLRMVPRSRADRLILHKNGKWRRECRQGVVCSWLAGLRLFTLNEDFNFQSESNIEYYHYLDTTPYDTNFATGSYVTKTSNGLLGLQFGPEWVLRQCRAEFSMGAKAAAYVNFAEQQSWINVTGAAGDEFSDGEDIDYYQALSRNNAATSIQLDFTASYKVRPNFILKASYELFYLAGLVLAPEQVDMSLDESITINNGGSLLFQSGTLGFEYLW